MVQPQTVLVWRRRLVARRWAYPARRSRGRPPTEADLAQLTVRLASENATRGYRRAHGELVGLGVPGRTLYRVAGPPPPWAQPAPRRSGPSWSQFLAAQAKGVLPCDFFCVDTVFLQRLYVLIFIEHAARRAHLGGITAHPTGPWVTPPARELAERFSGLRSLARHRDAKFNTSFDGVSASKGTEVIRTPVRAPGANAICERAVGTLRRECLNRMLTCGHRHLNKVLTQYLAHYNGHRPHRALAQRCPDGHPSEVRGAGSPILRHDLLGGSSTKYRAA